MTISLALTALGVSRCVARPRAAGSVAHSWMLDNVQVSAMYSGEFGDGRHAGLGGGSVLTRSSRGAEEVAEKLVVRPKLRPRGLKARTDFRA
jgi:hypothetical protein